MGLDPEDFFEEGEDGWEEVEEDEYQVLRIFHTPFRPSKHYKIPAKTQAQLSSLAKDLDSNVSTLYEACASAARLTGSLNHRIEEDCLWVPVPVRNYKTKIPVEIFAQVLKPPMNKIFDLQRFIHMVYAVQEQEDSVMFNAGKLVYVEIPFIRFNRLEPAVGTC